MGLFFDVLSAINNPNQQASVSQLEAIAGSIQQIATSRGIQPAQMQTVVSVLGGLVRPVLQRQATASNSSLENLIGQVVSSGASLSTLQSLFPPQLQQQMSQIAAQKSGLSPDTIQSLLPTLIPAILNLLNMGARKPGMGQGNPLLNAFLDSDRDGNTDLGDVLKFANRFLSAP
ncbi:MAG: DUF937 domain-containing protein [Elainellaceae cyanobacterium]